MDTVSTTRLRSDIEANAEFGRIDADEGRGRTVLAGTDANRDARDRFVERLADAGLAVTIDPVGNIVGRWIPDSADPDAAPVASGSHLDSVPKGGIFDGPLGVYGALEAVRALQDAAVELARPVDVVCFTEEEGQRFGNGLVGSSVATGRSTVSETLSFTDESGLSFREAFDRIGYHGSGTVDADEWSAWIELHVEQGTRLEEAGAKAGIVSDIAGITHCYADVIGSADHAGSTPMDGRSDALAAASTLVLDVESEASHVAAEESPTAVGTVGSLDVSPNATNVIPGNARVGVDIRDVDSESIESLVSALEASARRIAADRNVAVEVKRPYNVPPQPMAERCRSGLRRAAEAGGIPALELHSGAAHDTMNVARVTDAGLLFAPSRNGVSHNPREWTDWADCAAATAVLAGAIRNLAT
ncbi:amidase [Halorubrum saccharovorum]|uniref:Amidase n=1 Tax=Halorubrum saccharovorum TaxID=2248 RepID=A0A0F8BHM0_9EURY|nr:M20 family metallo-hydrolase [Halorubrum saccharovorum]KKF39693.1 amidase [Halorubrum saccharovorum]